MSGFRTKLEQNVINEQIKKYNVDDPENHRKADVHFGRVRPYKEASVEDVALCLGPEIPSVRSRVLYYKDPYTGQIQREYNLSAEEANKYIFQNGKIVGMKQESMVYDVAQNIKPAPRGANYDDLTYLISDYPTTTKELFETNKGSKDYYDGLSTDWALLDRINTYSSGSTNKPLNELKLQTYDLSTNVNILDDNYRFKYVKPIDMNGKKRQKFMNFMPQE